METKRTPASRENSAVRESLKSVAGLARSRVEPIIVWSWNVFIACMVAGNASPPFLSSALSVAAVAFVTLAVYLYNDLTDAFMDKLNTVKKNRPLPAGEAYPEDAKKFIFLLGMTGLVLAFLADVHSFLFILVYLFLFTVYSFPGIRLKRRFLCKEFIIALGIPITGLVGIYGAAHSFVARAFFANIIMAVFTYMAQPVLTDSTDVEEDLLAGVKSLATVWSWKRRVQVLVAGVMTVTLLILGTYKELGFNAVLPGYAVVGGAIFLGLAAPMLRDYEEDKVYRARKIAYGYFFLLQLFFVVGSLPL